MKVPKIVEGGQYDFLIWDDPDTGMPMGKAQTPRGEVAYGPAPIELVSVDPGKFFDQVPHDVTVGFVNKDDTVTRVNKNRLQ